MSTELRVLDLISRRTGDQAVAIARGVTSLGETPVVWAEVSAAAVVAAIRGRNAMCPLSTLATVELSRWAAARLIARERPPKRLWQADWSGPSFPSRHTALGSVGLVLVAHTLAPGQERCTMPVVAALAGCVGASRIVLGVHWPTDVLAGWAIAATVAFIERKGFAGVRCRPRHLLSGGHMAAPPLTSAHLTTIG